ncbi:glycosyltransferase [Aeromonas sp. QDB62]|uniref:glycosyltransferase n=1 Tax=Aeromonas sp. QDB62 TaxID=2990499 RepID=UPI0022E03455|nr:glycosyltransferase [Aeromonas sp. QDB62]
MVKVAILLSSFNGVKYISEQINSLLAQECENARVDIFIRDDGSIDKTTDIISKYADAHKNIFLIKGGNVGVTHSFFKLIVLEQVKGYDFYAFCDQDDVWIKDKLTAMIAAVNNDKACLVCCSYTVADVNLNSVRDVLLCSKNIELGQLLVDNNIPGCAMVFNQKLYNLIEKSLHNPIAWKVSIHDLWVLMIAAVFGEIRTVNNIGILYRQHNNNAIGASTTILSRLKRSIKSTLRMRDKHSYIDDAVIFYQIFKDNDIPIKAVKVLEDAVHSGGKISSRLKMVFSNNLYKKGMHRNIYFRLRVLFHFYKNHFNKSDL